MDTEEAPLTEDEIKSAAAILARLNADSLPFVIFHQIARLTVTPIIELVPLRRIDDKVQVLLLQRVSDDPAWPSQWHVPGTVIKATDTIEGAFNRIYGGELSSVESTKPKFVKNVLRDSGSGQELSMVYYVEVTGTPTVGRFYEIDDLPDSMMSSQLDLIPTVANDPLAKT